MRFDEFKQSSVITSKSECDKKIDSLVFETKIFRATLKKLNNHALSNSSRQDICESLKLIMLVIDSINADIDNDCSSFLNDQRVIFARALISWLKQESKKLCGS
jgi:hypothetical protein